MKHAELIGKSCDFQSIETQEVFSGVLVTCDKGKVVFVVGVIAVVTDER